MPAEIIECGEADTVSSAMRPPAWQSDLWAAAGRDVPVMISGGPVESKEIAYQLSLSRSPRPRVRIVDCREIAATDAVKTLARRDNDHRPEILLLQEVHALSQDDQALLEQQLERALLYLDSGPPVRVLVSSSGPLFSRVVQGEFRARLYYLLNMIHIELPSEEQAG